MLLRNIFLKELRDRRISLFWWSISFFLLILMVAWVFPSIQKAGAGYQSYVKSLPDAFKAAFMLEKAADLTTGKGFLNVELFSMMIPVMFIIFAVGFGSSAIAGEEETGTLDLLLTNPLPRWQVLLEKFVAMFLGTVLLGVVVWLSLIISTAAFDMNVGAGPLAAATASSTLVGLTFGAISLAVGSATGRKAVAIGIAVALTTGSYLLNVLAKSVESLKDYNKLSLFYYQVNADPLNKGLYWGDVAVFVGVMAVFLIIAFLGFQHRDLAV